ncbi:MAG: CvpA family protein [Bacilli bacterium]|nr:CvpA family protein [Bacilli bacterium]
MDFSQLLTVDNILLALNILFIVVVVFRALIGLIRGTRKSIYYFAATTIVIVLGLIFMRPVASFLLDFNLSSYNINVPIGDGYALTTGRELISQLLQDYLFGAVDASDTVTMSIIMGAVEMIIRIVYFIVTIILAITLYKIIFDIIWLIFFKPKKVKNEKGKMVKPKLKKFSRLGGLGIGTLKGVLVAVLFFFLFAGFSSVVTAINDTVELKSHETTYDLVLLGSDAVLVEEQGGSPLDGLIPDDMKQYLSVFTEYRSRTIPGFVYGIVKFDGAGLDELVFDELFKINIENEKLAKNQKFKLRKELTDVADILQTLAGGDKDFISKVSSGDLSTITEDNLNLAIEKLSKLEIVNVVVPVALEFVCLSDKVKEEAPEIGDILKDVDIDEFMSIDYISDIQKFGYSFVDVLSLLEFNSGKEEISFLDFDPKTVEKIFKSIGDTEILQKVVPYAIDYVFTMDEIKESIESLGLDSEEVINSVKGIENWGTEISKIGTIISKVLELGIDGSAIKNLDFNDIYFDKINDLVEAIFDSQLMDKSLSIFVDYGLKQLPEEVSQYISIDKDINWKEELTPLINGAIVLFKSGLTNISEDTDPMDVISNISEQTIDELGEYLAQSNIIINSLNGLIEMLLSQMGDDSVLNGFTFQTFTEEEIAAGNGWTQEELSSLLKVAKILVDMNIFTEGGAQNALAELKDEDIDKIVTHLSKSRLFKRNLTNVLQFVISSISTEESLELVTLTEEEWTETELRSIFNAVKEIIPLVNGDFTAVSEEQINKISSSVIESKFIVKNFGNLIKFALSSSGADLGFEISGLDDEDIWTKQEIKSLLASAKTLIPYASEENFLEVLTLPSEAFEDFLNSKLITNSLRDFVKANTKVDELGNPTGSFDLSILKGVDLIKDDEWEDIILNDEVIFNITAKVLKVTNPNNKLNELGAFRFDIYVNDELVGYTENGTYNFDSEVDSSKVSVKARKSGEIRRVLNAITTVGSALISGDGFNSEALISEITNITENDIDKLTASIIITETIKSYLVSTVSEAGYGLVVNEITDLATELKALIKAVHYLFGDNVDLGSLEFESSDILNNVVALTNSIEAEDGEMISRRVIDNSDMHIVYNNDNIDELISKLELLSNDEIGENVDLYGIATLSTYNARNNNYDITIGYLNTPIVIKEATFESTKYQKYNALLGFAIEASGKLYKDGEGKYYLIDATINKVMDYNNYVEEYVEADQVGEILKSQILVDTVKGFIEGEAEKNSILVLPEGEIEWNDYMEGNEVKCGEFRALFTSLQLLFPSGNVDLDNISLNNLFDCNDSELDTFLSSRILVESVKKIVSDLDTRNPDGSGDTTILVNNDKINEKGWKEEIKSMIKAVKFVFGSNVDLNNIDVDPNKVLLASDEELNDILDSVIVSETIVKIIYDQSNINYLGDAQEGGVIYIPKDNEDHYYVLSSSFWYDTLDNENVAFNYNSANKKVNILDMSLVKGKMLRLYINNKYVGALINGEITIDDSYGAIDVSKLAVKSYNYGEVRKIFKGIQEMFTTVDPMTSEKTINVDFNNIDANTILDKDDDAFDVMLDSQVLTNTIKKYIVDLDTRNPDGSGDTTILVNEEKIDEVGWKTEIKNMIKAIKVVFGDDVDLNNIDVDANKVLEASDEDLDIILSSIIVSETIVKVIYDQSNVTYLGVEKEGGTIFIPKDNEDHYYVLSSSFWYDQDETPGEIRKIFKGIQEMFTTVDPMTSEKTINVDFNNINADSILDKSDDSIDIIFDSAVLTNTVRKYVIDLDTRETEGTTVIYVNEANILLRHSWKQEIKALLKAFKSVVKPDGEGHYSLSSASDIDVNACLDVNNKEKLLSSIIICDTIIPNLENNDLVYTREGLDWYGSNGLNGELAKFIDAASLVLKNELGEIDINNFDENNLTRLTNDINAANKYALNGDDRYVDEVGVLLESTVLRDTIASHILDMKTIDLVVRETSVVNDNYWNDHMVLEVKVSGEIRSLLTSINILLNGAKLSEFTFDVDTILSKSKSDISTAISGSDIVSGTCANTLTDLLYNGSLNGKIAEPESGTRMEYVENDQVHLIWVLKDLNDEYNIKYDSFNYETFKTAIATDSDSYLLSDIICESTILEDSIGTLLKSIINGNESLTASIKTKVVARIDTIDSWANPEVEGSVKPYGEFAKILKALTVLDTFGQTSSTLDPATMKEPLMILNASTALQPIVSEVLDKALDSISDWKKAEYSLTPVEWNYEIDLLVDLIDFVETKFGGDISSVTNASDLTGSDLETLIIYIARSRILDIAHISDIVAEAVDGIFGAGTFVDGEVIGPEYASNNSGSIVTTIDSPAKDSLTAAVVTVSGYSNDNYDSFVVNWSTEAHGLQLSITQLKAINFSNMFVPGTSYDEVTGLTELNYVHEMRMIGRFLDYCEETMTLANTVASVASKYSVSKGAAATWEEAFVNKATAL